jgi:hypothetical protein
MNPPVPVLRGVCGTVPYAGCAIRKVGALLSEFGRVVERRSDLFGRSGYQEGGTRFWKVERD